MEIHQSRMLAEESPPDYGHFGEKQQRGRGRGRGGFQRGGRGGFGQRGGFDKRGGDGYKNDRDNKSGF